MKSETIIKIRTENYATPLFVEAEEFVDEMKNIPEIIAHYANEFFFEKHIGDLSSQGKAIPFYNQ